jgi:hypothetical protein
VRRLGDCTYRHDWVNGTCNTCGYRCPDCLVIQVRAAGQGHSDDLEEYELCPYCGPSGLDPVTKPSESDS